MKSKLYRVLVLLVAIAMMIPSFAMADDPTPATPTLTLSGTTEYKRNWSCDDFGYLSFNETKFSVTGIPQGTTNGFVEWKLDNTKKFSFTSSGPVEGTTTMNVSSTECTDLNAPTIFLSADAFNDVLANAGKTDVSAKVTGQLYLDYKAVGSPVEITVKVSKVDVDGIKFKDAIGTNPTQIDLGNKQSENILKYVDVYYTGTDAAPKASYDIDDVFYKVVEGGEYAYVNQYGNIFFQKATPEGKKIKVVVYIPGSANASEAKSAAIHEYTVIGPDDGQPEETPQEPQTYQFVAFTTGAEGKVYTTSNSTITLWQSNDEDGENLIKTIPANPGNRFNDELVWTIDKPEYASREVTSTKVELSFNTGLGVDEYPPVKVTVASQQNPSVTDYCYVQYVPYEVPETEDKGYTKLAFQPFKEITVVEDDSVNLLKYLVAEKATDSNDTLIWQNDKKLYINGTQIQGLKAKYSPVTVTVKSKLSGKSDNFKINVVKSVTPEEGTYSKVEFAVNSVETTTRSIDILPFLKLEGDGNLSQLIFTASDPNVAFVYKVGDKVWVMFRKDTLKDGDKVTIEVRNGYSGTTTEPSKLEVIYVKNPEEDPATYKIGFTKKSLDVPLSAGSINLGDYVYVQDKDGNKIPTDEARNVLGNLIWNTDNAAVATVFSGYVYPNKAGTVTISMRTGYSVEKAETITLNIKKDEETVKDVIKGIKFNTDKEIEVVERYSIDAFDYLIFTDMDGKEVTDNTKREAIKSLLNWTSTDQTVASVDTTGYVSSKKEGSTTINVRYNNGQEKQTASLKIKVVKAESETYTKMKFAEPNPLEVHIDEDDYEFNAMKYLALEGKGSPDDLKWSSSDTNIATVDQNGKVCFAAFKKEKIPASGDVPAHEVDVFDKLKAKDGDSVKITVTCPDADPALEPATLTLNIKYEIKPYTELKFVLDEVTVAGNIDDLGSYLVTKGNEFNQDELIWTSSNQQVAKVSSAGKLTWNTVEVQNGTTKKEFIDVLDGTKVVISVRSKLNKDDKASAKITLIYNDNKVAIKKMELTQAEFELDPDETVKDIYLGRYVKTTPAEHDDVLIFTSDDPSVVITDNKAAIDAKLLGDGEAHITVRSMLNPDVSEKFTFKVKKVAATSIKFVDAPKNFYPEKEDGKETLKKLPLTDYLVIKPANYDTANLVWESSDPTVAKVNNGKVTYVQAGKVTITATDKVGGKSDKVELTLGEKHPVESIALKDITMDADDTYLLKDFLTCKPLDADLDESRLKFTSSNREVAEVVINESVISPNSTIVDDINRDYTRGPKLVAYKAGTTKITAYYELEDGSSLKATATVTVEDIELEKVKISQDKYTLKLNTKVSAPVRFNVEPYNCSFEPADLYVVSADPEIVEVSEITYGTKESHKGMFTITGKKPGTAWVVVKRAKDDKALDACKVKVKAVAVKSVGWEKKNVKMYYYDDGREETAPIDVTLTLKKSNKVYRNTLDVKPIINPENAYCKVSFETTDPSVAFINDQSAIDFLTVDAAKTVKLVCVGPGNCKITMKVDDGKKVRKAVMKVEVQTKLPKMKMSQSKATLKLEKGKDTLQLRAYDANTDTDMEVKWTSSNKKVVKVNAEGKVRAIGAGKATITATTKNGQKQVVKCKITVKAPSTENVAAKKITGDTKVTVKAGEKKALEIKVKPEGAKVTFTSSDSKIVKVTKDGTIKGIKAGKATITVKAAEGKAELKIKVVVK